MHCSFVWATAKGSSGWGRDLTSSCFVSSFPGGQAPSSGYLHAILKLQFSQNTHLNCQGCSSGEISGFTAAGADPALWHRALQPGSHSGAEQHHPELSRCSWGASHLFACWGRTGSYRGSVKPFAVKPTGLICPFELAGWVQMQLTLCDLVKKGLRNIICKGVVIWETQAMRLFQFISTLALHLQFRRFVIPS